MIAPFDPSSSAGRLTSPVEAGPGGRLHAGIAGLGLLAAGCAAGGLAVAAAASQQRWARTARQALERLDAAARRAAPAGGGLVQPESLSGLPEPVARYLARALVPGRRLADRVRIEQAGWLRASADSAWKPFRAVQHATTHPPGFVWQAAVQLAPGLTVQVRDQYVAGAGASQARLARLVPLGAPRDARRVDAASLMRWLAEAAWWPGALLPRAGLSWAGLGEREAQATLEDGLARVSVDFSFDAHARLHACQALRYRDAGGGQAVLTPWRGRYFDHQRIAGMEMPTAAEVSWQLPGAGWTPVWRGTLVAARYV